MKLSASVVEEAVGDYPEVQPLSTVEEEHIELLPELFASGNYGWRDAEWVVQWYYRRFLGAYPNRARRAVEDAYDRNDYEAVHDAITVAVEADTAAEALDALTELDGVDVAVGSAFLQFIDPDSYVAVDERAWNVLLEADDLAEAYPDPLTVTDYERFLDTYRTVTERCDCSLWDLYRTLWVLKEK